MSQISQQNKPAYTGTIQQYNALPWNIKQYYSSPTEKQQPSSKTPVTTQKPKFTPTQILQQNKTFYNAYTTGKISKTEYQQAMKYQKGKLGESRTYYQKNPKVTSSEVMALQRDYPQLYQQTRGKVITNIEITGKGAQVEYLEQQQYQQLTQPNPELPSNAPERIQQQKQQRKKVDISRLSPLGKSPWQQAGLPQAPREVQETAKYVGTVATIAVVAPELIPFVTTKGLLVSAGIGAGLSEAFKFGTTGQHLTIEEAGQAALIGQAFYGVSQGVTYGLAKTSPKVAYLLRGSGPKSMFARATLASGISGTTSYVTSGGDIAEAGKGAAYGAAFSLGLDVLSPAVSALRAKLPKWFPGSVEQLEPSGTTMGKTGEAQTYKSKPLEKLGGKSLRVVGDVTENPIGTKGVTYETMVREYVGQRIPTAHATLNPSKFSLSVGGETLLQGYPSEGAGFRAYQELYPFYSAPGSEGTVTVYGGYMGVGEGYSGESPKIVVGGKSTVLATLDTEISSELLRQSGESIDDYITRFTQASGKTGLSPETVIGASAERQVSTPTTYTRKGETLPGSLFVSEGKVGTFQVREPPKGLLAKVPVLRTIFSRYTQFTLYKGRFASVAKTASPRTITQEPKPIVNLPSRSVVSFPIIASPTVVSQRFGKKETITTQVKTQPSIAISQISKSSQKSFASKSLRSYPSRTTSSLFQLQTSKVSDSLKSQPSSSPTRLESTKSQRSQPSLMAKSQAPSKISTLIIPSFKGSPLKPKRIKGGLWRKRKHPIPTPEEVTENLLGKRRGKR